MNIYFTSKKDMIYFLAVWGTALLMFLSVIFNLSFTVLDLLWGLIGSLSIGFMAWIWFKTGYRIDAKTIHIQNGPFKTTVSISDMKRMSTRKSLLATPALAMDRLVLHYGTYGEIQVSPKDAHGFITLLLAQNPQIQLTEELSKYIKTVK